MIPPLPPPERFSANSAPPELMIRSPLTLNAMLQALSPTPSSLQLTTPLMIRLPSLTVKTPLATPSWSAAEPSSDANDCVPERVTSCAKMAGATRSAKTGARSRSDRDRIGTFPPLKLLSIVWDMDRVTWTLPALHAGTLSLVERQFNVTSLAAQLLIAISCVKTERRSRRRSVFFSL